MRTKYIFRNGIPLNIEYENGVLKIDDADDIAFRHATEEDRILAIDLNTGKTTNKYINEHSKKEPNLEKLNKIRKEQGLKVLSRREWQNNITKSSSDSNSLREKARKDFQAKLSKCATTRTVCNAANAYFKTIGKNVTVSLGKVDVDIAKSIVKHIDNLTDKWKTHCSGIDTKCKENNVAGFCKTVMERNGSATCKISLNSNPTMMDGKEEYQANQNNVLPWSVNRNAKTMHLATITHEMGHSIFGVRTDEQVYKAHPKECEELKKIYQEYMDKYSGAKRDYVKLRNKQTSYEHLKEYINENKQKIEQANTDKEKEKWKKMLDFNSTLIKKFEFTDDDYKKREQCSKRLEGIISEYSMTSVDEMIAESFADCTLNENPNPYSKRVMAIIERVAKND